MTDARACAIMRLQQGTTKKAARQGKAANGPRQKNREPETTRTGHLETGTKPGGENEKGAAENRRENRRGDTRYNEGLATREGTEPEARGNQEGLQQQGSRSGTESDSGDARRKAKNQQGS